MEVTGTASDETIQFRYNYAGEKVWQKVGSEAPRKYYGPYADYSYVDDGDPNGLSEINTQHFFIAGIRVTTSTQNLGPNGMAAIPPVAIPPEIVLGVCLSLWGLVGVVVFVRPRQSKGGRLLSPGPMAAAVLTIVWIQIPSSLLFPSMVLAGAPPPPPSDVLHLHVDRPGSTHAVTNEAGGLVTQIRYDAYGEVRGRFDGSGNPIGAGDDVRHEYTGHERVGTLVDAGARFYDPELAQFLTPDPARQFQSPYAYGPGDPVNGTDPSGAIWSILSPLIGFALTFLSYAAIATSALSFISGVVLGNPGAALVGLFGVATGFLGLTFAGASSEAGLVAVAAIGEGGLLQGAAAGLGAYAFVQSLRGRSVSPLVAIAQAAISLASLAYAASKASRAASPLEGSSDSWDRSVGVEYAQHGGANGPWSLDYYEIRPPDADGYLTLGEATWNWRNGMGTPLDVDLSTLDLSGLSVSDFPGGPGSRIAFKTAKPFDFLVHGTITLELSPSGAGVRALPDVYDFDIKPWSVRTTLRNIYTKLGDVYAGPGTPFQVRFVGIVPVAP